MTPIFKTAVFPSKYIQGPGAISVLPEWINKMGTRAVLIAGKTALREIVPGLLASGLKGAVVEAFGGECTDAEITRIAASARKAGCDVAVALGGGKVIDTAKAVSQQIESKIIIVPTIASNDAPCSAVSVVYTPEGAFHHTVYLKQNPDLVLMDSEIIAKAPVRTLIAGIGDALATWFEADACRASGSLNEVGAHGTRTAYALARLCYDTILEFSVEACESCRQQKVTPALENVIEANTLLSGLGFESAGLASAHSIHNGLTQLPATHAYFHGEKVAFGVLAGLFLADRPESLKKEVYDFCRKVGLPCTLAQIGIVNPTDEELMKVASAACAPQEFIWHEPVEVTPAKVVEAMKQADAKGKTTFNSL
jgi:glycerol dehydrogenase